ncbi:MULTISPECIES: molybdate ABC transporter substrate-binding protein [Methylococcus]|uniref:molybdate ABC transporter substrate-binding protein n=2 Tax=Methylococcaceae TaxID=403 RepID=UPI001C52A7A5|nr:molybdate ABC transporter substrate-binding protein [Methylococcus capsulatus]QXP91792.1 molybdate ABC transporter substrate-binding protein [Methylococcus capsulatus]
MEHRNIIRLLVAVAGLVMAGQPGAVELTVSAASSLTQAFKDMARRYEEMHPDAKVFVNFGASGVLLQQIAKGAPVDVFACADQETMDEAVKIGLAHANERRDFAANTLVLVVPKGQSVSLGHLSELTQAAVRRIAIGNPDSVPVGRYARRALEKAGLWEAVATKAITTQNVRQSLDYVSRGEVDAGFVYATDAGEAADRVRIAFEVPLDVAIRYPIAPLADAAHAEEARRFTGFVLSADGQAILASHGFPKP